MSIGIPDRYFALAARSNARLAPLPKVARALWRYVDDLPSSVVSIATEAGCSESCVRDWARAAGLPARPHKLADRYRDGRREQMVAAYLEHGSFSAAAKHLGVSVGMVSRVVRDEGVAERPVGEVISERLSEEFPPPTGFLTVWQAARIIGRRPSTLSRQCSQGRVPGARLVPRRDGDKRKRWVVPEAWLQDQRDAATVAGSVVKRNEWLLVGPLVDWLLLQDGSVGEIAGGSEPVERALRRFMSGEQATVELGWADAFLVARHLRLEDVWPDVDAALIEGREIRFRNQHGFGSPAKGGGAGVLAA